ncbi:hypothetical protein LCGC14_1813680 [marine sediment metagenome]|uniref:Uncharacterized protein n=1 Tax=marine sediment metagenome TaxID=412755 RepID=A0A0F9JKL4_9ZZZZ
MGEHMAAWFETIDQVALGRINTVQDDVLTPTGADRFLVPDEYNWIHWAYATGVNLSGARIVTPSLEVNKSDLDIVPFQDGSDLLDRHEVAIWVPKRFIELVPSESIEVQTSEDGGTTSQQAFVVLGTAENEPMADGQIRSIRANGTTTLTADQWTPVTLTPESSLEPGRYQLVHFMCHGVSPIAARWLPQGGGFRPGMFCSPAASPGQFDWSPEVWDRLGWHNMLEFTHITFPQLEIFAISADTVQTVQMWVIRIGDL